jgi:hypothetical protein
LPGPRRRSRRLAKPPCVVPRSRAKPSTAWLVAAALSAGCGGSSSASERTASPAAPDHAASPDRAPEPAAPAAQPEPQAVEAPPPTPQCGTAAQCYAEGRSAARKQPERAADLLAEACDQDLARACSELAALYETGRGVPQDDRRAKQLREHACALGSIAACDELGH